MDTELLLFCILLLIITILGFIGNIRFFITNIKEKHIHKQLLVFMTALHTPYCMIVILDLLRVFIGIPLTRSSCLRFIGAISALLSVTQSILHVLIGLELIVLIAAPLWFRHLKAWWFHVPVYSGFLFSGSLIYMSWISNEDHPIVLCAPQTALTTDFLFIGNTFIFACNIIVTIEYATMLALLWTKKCMLRDNLTERFIISSTILAIVFICSFTDIAIIRYSLPLSELLNVLPSTIHTFATLPAVLTFSQTHFVYFFVSSKNRQAFRKRGPIALFSSNSSTDEVVVVAK